jgi:hypothetical protein
MDMTTLNPMREQFEMSPPSIAVNQAILGHPKQFLGPGTRWRRKRASSIESAPTAPTVPAEL